MEGTYHDIEGMSMDSLARTRNKWGEAVTAAGFTIVPNHLLGINEFVDEENKLSPTEMVVLLQILMAWWSAERMPFPSKSTISSRAGLSARQVQRALAALERKGILQRHARYGEDNARRSNQYNLVDLVAKVQGLVEISPEAFRAKKSKNQNKSGQ